MESFVGSKKLFEVDVLLASGGIFRTEVMWSLWQLSSVCVFGRCAL